MTPSLAAEDGSEFRLLIAALDREGSAQRTGALPDGLADRIFATSVIELRRSTAATAGTLNFGSSDRQETGERSFLRLVDDGRPHRRAAFWRRLAPLAAMAACIGIAALVTTPSMVVALRAASAEAPPPISLAAADETTLALATLYQRDSDRSWADVSLASTDPSLIGITTGDRRPLASVRNASMIPIVEAHQMDINDFAEEFALIEAAMASAGSRRF